MIWQPIATAPRDGTHLLLAVPGYRHAVLGHYFQHERREFGEVVSIYEGWSDGSLRLGGEPPEPTHWMPLPEMPPASDEAAAA